MPLASAVLALALADCDDVVRSSSGDLFLACHSPSDKFSFRVKGVAKADDEMDGYVIRLKKDTWEVLWVTRIGGSAYDLASRVAVDERGNVWVAGFTKSADFPVTGDAWQKTYGGGGDAFLVKLSFDGEILFSTFAGGPKSEFGNAIVIAGGEPVFGGTSDGDGFVQRGPAKRITFGGSGEEKLTGIAYFKGKLFATGYTKSRDWGKLRGASDAFVVTLDANSLSIQNTALIGGSGDDSSWGIAVDARGRAFLAGQTDSKDFPGVERGYQRANRGGVDAFVAQVGGAATYFGGSQKDEAGYDGQNIAIDSAGNICIAGMTHSSDLPASGSHGGGDGDAFVARFSPDLSKLQFASYSGGDGREAGEGIAVIPGGVVMTMVQFGNKAGIPVGPFVAQSVISIWK